MAIPGFIAKKVGMTRMVDTEGRLVPVTLMQLDDQRVTKVITPETQGYHALQVGYYAKPEHRLNKPTLTKLRKAGVEQNFTRFKEFRLESPVEGVAAGHEFSLADFASVAAVDVTGLTKGRGFQGSIKRFDLARGRMTHGSHYHRRPGSLGMRQTPGRVFKGKPQPGQMGDVQRTIQNLKVMDVDSENRVIAIKGSIPGSRGGYVVIRPSIKAK